MLQKFCNRAGEFSVTGCPMLYTGARYCRMKGSVPVLFLNLHSKRERGEKLGIENFKTKHTEYLHRCASKARL